MPQLYLQIHDNPKQMLANPAEDELGPSRRGPAIGATPNARLTFGASRDHSQSVRVGAQEGAEQAQEGRGQGEGGQGG